jgi:predicted hydrocarbon binding protein
VIHDNCIDNFVEEKMSPNKIPPSGLYYPNRIARITFVAIENVLGKDKLNELLILQGLDHYIDNYPPNNFDRKFDFADFSALQEGLEITTNREAICKVGVSCYRMGLQNFGNVAGLGGVTVGLRVLSLNVKMKLGLLSMATIFSAFSDQESKVEERDTHFEYIITNCPVCWDRTKDAPTCVMAGAMLEEGLSWLTEGMSFSVVETQCRAMGHKACIFEISKEPIGPASKS